MDRPRSAHSSAYGLITIEDRGTEELRFQDGRRAGGVAVVAHHRYSWRPPLDMQWRFPDGFVIEVDCKVRPDGMRTFLPFGGYESFIHNAFVAGLEILIELGRLGPWGHHSYCGMKLIFNAVRDMREHFNRSFNFVRDLYIRLPGRESRNERNVLPSDLGTTADGRGRKWSIRQLLECGREAARASGVTRPGTRECIIYGLLAAARLNPLRIKGKNLQLLVRMALYDLPSGERPPRKLVNQVSERILVAVQQHLGDSTDEFHKWFAGPHNNFLKAIADQPNSPGGALPREDVRRVFLDRGFEAYTYVAGCMEAFAKWFQKSLPEKLTRAEQRQFECIFMRQHYLGGLPLMLVMERSQIIRGPILDIWRDPGNRQSKRVLHRLLFFYAQMVANRRAADRRFKPKGTSRTPGPKKHIQNLGAEDRHIASPRDRQSRTSAFADHTRTQSQARMSAIAGYIRTERGLPRRCRCGPLRVKLISRADDQIELQCECDCGEISELMTVTMNEIRQSGDASGTDGLEASSID